jgi:hypothetical protein
MRPIAIRTSARLRRTAVLPLAAAFLLAAAGCGGDSSAVPADAIAVVGNESVAKAELVHRLDQARASARKSRRPFPKPGTVPYLQIREQLIQFLVGRAQAAEDAEERGIEFSDEDVEQRRKELVRQYFGGNEELYERQLRGSGIPGDQARADIEAMLIQAALLAKVGNEVKVSDAEMRRYYTTNRRKYARPYGQVKEAIREKLLQTKRSEASSKYLLQLARKKNVRYQVGFGPRA